jgi:hypothetical protein
LNRKWRLEKHAENRRAAENAEAVFV